MGSKERREGERAELRRKILAAAEELFVADGYGNVSMRKIAAKIEYSPTTLYRFFASKDEIMDQLIADGYLGVYGRYQEVITRRGDDPLTTLHEIITAYVEFALANPNHYELWFATSQLKLVDGRLTMHHGSAVYSVYSVWLDCIDECLRRAGPANRNRFDVFQMVWTMVHGLVSLRIHHRSFPWLPLQDHLDTLFAALDRELLGGDQTMLTTNS